ncbi:MAG TPA: glycosyltransferase [Holophagaceae bacterium]|nr:glycosyltransferase [Holophagaceae bacterium]
MYDVVFLTDQLGRGGAETQLVRIATTLKARGWKVGILSLFPWSDFAEELAAAGIPHEVCEPSRMPKNRPLIPFRMTLRLLRVLRAWKPSALVTFSYHSDVLGRVCGRLAGVPVVIGSLRTAYAKSPMRERVYRATEPLVDLTISNSQAGVAYMVSRRVLTLRKTRVIPNGMFTADYPSPAPREEVRRELGLDPEDFLWLAVGTLNPAKDYPGLLQAAARCAEAEPRFRLRIAGGGEARAGLEAEAAALGLQDRVAFLGKRADVPRLFKAADGFVLSSAWEGLPNAVMEALASGLPVVATDVGGVRELIEPGRSGWIVPPRDPDALGRALQEVMALDGEARAAAGAEGRARMVAGHDNTRVADRWEQELRQAVAAKRGRGRRAAPAFVVSLDFELLWGMRDKRTVETYGRNLLGEREAIPAMLALFRKYGVRATWAAVGLTLFDRKADLLDHLPELRPTYARPELDPYRDLDHIGDDERSDPYHYGLSLARQILDCEGMELGSHTFSHYYCLEAGQTPEQFRADLAAASAAIARLAPPPESLVFPRNQCHVGYLPLCAEAGLTTFRGNEAAWMYREDTNERRQAPIQRAARLLDNYVDLSGANGFVPHEAGGLVNCPSSRFLRPYHPRLARLEGLRLRRIRKAMEAAARAGESFHLWWHPHNFGVDLNENLAALENLLRCHVALRDRYGVVPLTMGELARRTRGEAPAPGTGPAPWSASA